MIEDKEMYLLGIDNGGSDIKCAVYDLNGKELAISRTQIPMNIPEAGFTERDVGKCMGSKC